MKHFQLDYCKSYQFKLDVKDDLIINLKLQTLIFFSTKFFNVSATDVSKATCKCGSAVWHGRSLHTYSTVPHINHLDTVQEATYYKEN